MSTRFARFVARYAEWIDRHRRAVLAVAGVLAVVAGVLASRLTVYSDFSYLLPQDAPSVRQIRELETRVHNFGIVMLAVVSDDPVQRAAAAQALRDRIAAIDDGLIADISFDDSSSSSSRAIPGAPELYAQMQCLADGRLALAADPC